MYTEYYYTLLNAHKVLKEMREMPAFQDVPKKNFDFVLFFIANAGGALAKYCTDGDTVTGSAPIFRDGQHENRYFDFLQRMQSADDYHKPFAYLLALDTVCAEHAAEIFDFEGDAIKPGALSAAWQTGTSAKTVRLAFNLWNGYAYDGDGDEISSSFTPESLFCCDYLPFFFEAIKLRFKCYAN